MKKMLSLLMALLMLVLCTASAETTALTQTVSAPDGGYSFDVPADYIPMNSETMTALLTSDAMVELVAQMFGLTDVSQLDAYLAQLNANNMLYVYASGMGGNINAKSDEATLTMSQMVELKTQLDAAITQQYVAMGFLEENIVPREIQTIGDYTWYGIMASMMDVPVLVMMTVVDDVQYTITFTGIDEAECLSILASFRVHGASADTATLTELQTLVSPAGDYSFAVPADFILADSDLFKTLLTTDAMRQYMADALGLEDASQMEQYFAAIQASNMMIVYDSDFDGNLNIQETEALLTMDMIVLLKSAMDQSILQQYAALGVPEENMTFMDIQTIGGRRWYAAKVVFMGLDMQTMITVEDGKQFTFTFTKLEDAVVQTVLESFTVVAAE